jgi:hypothetical protein
MRGRRPACGLVFEPIDPEVESNRLKCFRRGSAPTTRRLAPRPSRHRGNPGPRRVHPSAWSGRAAAVPGSAGIRIRVSTFGPPLQPRPTHSDRALRGEATDPCKDCRRWLLLPAGSSARLSHWRRGGRPAGRRRGRRRCSCPGCGSPRRRAYGSPAGRRRWPVELGPRVDLVERELDAELRYPDGAGRVGGSSAPGAVARVAPERAERPGLRLHDHIQQDGRDRLVLVELVLLISTPGERTSKTTSGAGTATAFRSGDERAMRASGTRNAPPTGGRTVSSALSSSGSGRIREPEESALSPHHGRCDSPASNAKPTCLIMKPKMARPRGFEPLTPRSVVSGIQQKIRGCVA